MTRQAIESEMGRGHRRLPVAALLQLAVSGQHERPERGLVHLSAERRTDPDGQAMAQWARVRFDARHFVAVRMAVQCGQGLHIRRQPFGREESPLSQRGVQHGRRVSLAQDESIACRIGRIGGIHREHAEVQGGEDIGGGQIPTGMAHLRRVDHAKAQLPDVLRALRDRQRGHGFSHGSADTGRAAGGVHKNASIVFNAHAGHASDAMLNCQRGFPIRRAAPAVLLCLSVVTVASAQTTDPRTRPRTIVTTDPELDDSNSLVRFLLYSAEVQTRGAHLRQQPVPLAGRRQRHAVLRAEPRVSRGGVNLCPCTSWRWKPGERYIDEAVDIYAQVYPNLRVHDPNYPTPEYLRSRDS